MCPLPVRMLPVTAVAGRLGSLTVMGGFAKSKPPLRLGSRKWAAEWIFRAVRNNPNVAQAPAERDNRRRAVALRENASARRQVAAAGAHVFKQSVVRFGFCFSDMCRRGLHC